MARYEMSEFEWQVIKPVLPNKPRGVPQVNDRRAVVAVITPASRLAKDEYYSPTSTKLSTANAIKSRIYSGGSKTGDASRHNMTDCTHTFLSAITIAAIVIFWLN